MKYREPNESNNMAQEAKQYWSMTEGVFNCLIDEERTGAFKSAIFNTIRKDDVVVDMGTGSGVLAMFAANAGARKVYAVELDKDNIATLNSIFKNNGVADIITLIQGDVGKVELPEKVDVIMGEMVATGLIEELQVPATNNMLRFAKDNVRVVLKRYDTYIDIVSNNEKYYGQAFKIVRYEYPDLKKLKSVSFSDKYQISSVDLTKKNTDLAVNKEIEIEIKKNGLINGLRVSGKSFLYDGSVLEATFAYNYPIILPVDSIEVRKDDKFNVKISYIISGGMQTLNYSIHKI